MLEEKSTRAPKWPFYLADLILSGAALYALHRLGSPAGPWQFAIMAVCFAGLAFGAWLSITPWLLEYKTRFQLEEAADLRQSLAKLKDIEQISQQIHEAGGNWREAQSASEKTIQAAREISTRMDSEVKDFMKFLENANASEKNNLKLEIEKMRRGEGEWLQVSVRILDHIFALNSAAFKTGQINLINQLAHFQLACRDITRRVGLSAFAPNPGEAVDEKLHQVGEPATVPIPGATVAEVLACGFTFQGQLLRRALIRAAGATEPAPKIEPENSPQESLGF